jgi:hypothetical protein
MGTMGHWIKMDNFTLTWATPGTRIVHNERKYVHGYDRIIGWPTTLLSYRVFILFIELANVTIFEISPYKLT